MRPTTLFLFVDAFVARAELRWRGRQPEVVACRRQERGAGGVADRLDALLAEEPCRGTAVVFSDGATQFARLGICGMLWEAPLARLCRKSNPGTNLPKPLLAESLMVSPKGARPDRTVTAYPNVAALANGAGPPALCLNACASRAPWTRGP
jgi:hypothetical protein